jgi:hypothetical protein
METVAGRDGDGGRSASHRIGEPSGLARGGSPCFALAWLLVTSGALFAIVATAPEKTAIRGFEDRLEEGVASLIKNSLRRAKRVPDAPKFGVCFSCFAAHRNLSFHVGGCRSVFRRGSVQTCSERI